MKKQNIMIGAIFVLSMLMVGCAQEAAADAADTVVDMASNVDEAQNALDDYKETMSGVDAYGQEVLEGTQVEEPTAQPTQAGGYGFTYEGVTIAPDMDANVFLTAWGQPVHYYEAKSCAFEGMDKIYTYSGFEVTTYPNGDKDYISSILFKDDMVTTAEGVYLFMDKSDVLAVYGTDYTEEDGILVYAKGGMELQMIFDESDKLVSVEYVSLVLKEQ